MAARARLLRDIASAARAHSDEWTVDHMVEMLKLYGCYLRTVRERGVPETVLPVSFESFVADESLRADVAARCDAP